MLRLLWSPRVISWKGAVRSTSIVYNKSLSALKMATSETPIAQLPKRRRRTQFATASIQIDLLDGTGGLARLVFGVRTASLAVLKVTV
jgi:hypothetical protein